MAGVPSKQNQKDLTEFLKPTRYIDSDHPKIVAKAMELTQDARTDVEKAKRLFEYVRDSNTSDLCDTLVASETLACGGNSCSNRTILLAALCRAVGIPSRLHLQKVTLKGWRNKQTGEVRDLTVAHGLTGICLDGEWRLYESVGNKEKWISITGDESRGSEMPVVFCAEQDGLFPDDPRVIAETIPKHFADVTDGMLQLVDKINSGKL